MQMQKLSSKKVEKFNLPCPLYMEGFSGRCADCGSRQECISLAILGKMQDIESRLNSLAAK
jgi:hypothetical protein